MLLGEWKDLMESDGVRFEDGDRVGWVMDSVKRGLNEKNAGMVYQVRAHGETKVHVSFLSSDFGFLRFTSTPCYGTHPSHVV